jgi:hypothetical protein
MKVTRSQFYLVQLVVLILIAAGIGLLVWILTNNTPTAELAKLERIAQVDRMATTAGVYRGRMGDYQGVCGAIGSVAGVSCVEDTGGFSLEVALPEGAYYCVDSTGFAGERFSSRGSALQCQ